MVFEGVSGDVSRFDFCCFSKLCFGCFFACLGGCLRNLKQIKSECRRSQESKWVWLYLARWMLVYCILCIWLSVVLLLKIIDQCRWWEKWKRCRNWSRAASQWSPIWKWLRKQACLRDHRFLSFYLSPTRGLLVFRETVLGRGFLAQKKLWNQWTLRPTRVKWRIFWRSGSLAATHCVYHKVSSLRIKAKRW